VAIYPAFLQLLGSVVDPDPYVFGQPGSVSGPVSHKYGSGSGILL
jgi:hypothetical protein